VPAGKEVKLIDAALSAKMPPGGRLKLTLLDPGPMQCEEFLANVTAAAESK
jgi:hypothetical protein